MNELTIESVPSGAGVQIDGETIGVTPLTVPIAISLEDFRDECLYSYKVSCDWNILKRRLEDQTVSRLWWDLVNNERRSIALKSTENILYIYISKYRTGKANCEGGVGDWLTADCGINMVVRTWKFGTESPTGFQTYWQHPTTLEEHCLVPDIAYNLPCYTARIIKPATEGQPEFNHRVAALQVKENITDLNSWFLFQYVDLNIQPGESWQFPVPSTIIIMTRNQTILVSMDIRLSIEDFRAECLSNGSVACSWDVLKTRLEDKTVSELWWDLIETERRSIAEMAIKNTIFYTIHDVREGASECEGGGGEWKKAVCMQNGIIRYMQLSTPVAGVDTCYWKNNVGAEMCYVPTYPYNLPCNLVVCMGYEFGHMVCAIQVVHNPNVLSDWILFQYSSFDIKPGDQQLPHSSRVTVYQPYVLACNHMTECDIIAEFDI